MSPRLLNEPARLAGASLLRLQSDERLVTLAAGGHEAAFAVIVDRYRPALLRYCTSLVGSARAEDVVQQALVNAHTALLRTPDVRHLRSWLYRIAHNAALNTLRAVRDDVPLDPTHADPAGDPAEAAERSERLRSTLAAVQALPERQRAALVLRELEGRSHDEIADALGVTSGSARQHLMRARAAVRHAATALTPYPLLERLISAGGAATGAGSGMTDAAVGAGAGAGALVGKVGAAVLATGAVAGGAVGTRAIVVDHDASSRPAVTRTATPAAERPAPVATIPAATGAPVATPSSTTTTGAGDRGRDRRGRDDSRGEHRGRGRARGGDDAGRERGEARAGDDGRGRGRGRSGTTTPQTPTAQRQDERAAAPTNRSSESSDGRGRGRGRGRGGHGATTVAPVQPTATPQREDDGRGQGRGRGRGGDGGGDDD